MEFNYNNWPGELGAPYTDVNGDGKFTRGTDLPKVLGDETLFYVANDLDTATTASTYGSTPIGIEYQQTFYAFNTPELEDVVFKHIKIINKSANTINDMYLSYWADDDMGFAGDDFVGCDTLLSLGYTYNADNNDDDNYTTPPPAVGRVLLKGPVNGNDTLKMTSFIVGTKGTYTPDPNLGEYKGTVEFYNYMKGFFHDGKEITDIHSGDTTKFMVAGDPINKTGWFEGEGWLEGPGAGDRRYTMSSGPFNMEAGDTQNVVYAIFMARGTDNINSVKKLKEKALELHEFWGNNISTGTAKESDMIPLSYSLAQNYPNPFNPSTTIEYTIPARSTEYYSVLQVTFKVYDILGREVTTLVNQTQPPGRYKVEFDASSFASGVYFYELRSGSFTQTNKMLLLK
jgi:hypothetical protein